MPGQEKKSPVSIGFLAHVGAGRGALRKTLPKYNKNPKVPHLKCSGAVLLLFDRLHQVFDITIQCMG